MENKTKPKSATRKFLLAQAIFVLGVLVYLYFVNAPKALSPIAGKAVSEPDFIFEIENADTIILSRTPDFTDQIVLKNGEEIILPPGTYYWKVKNWFREGEVNSFVIEENTGFNIKDDVNEDLSEDYSYGNVDLNLENIGGKNG